VSASRVRGFKLQLLGNVDSTIEEETVMELTTTAGTYPGLRANVALFGTKRLASTPPNVSDVGTPLRPA